MTTSAARAPGWKRWLVLGVMLLIAIGATAYFLSAEKSGKSGMRKAPGFELQTADAKTVKLSDFKDTVVLVHFWASWCAPCIPELPEVIAAATRMPADSEGRAIRWILVSVDESWEKARKILDVSKLPANVTALLDPESKLADAFGTYQYPETYVLDRDHRIAGKWIGAQDWNGEWGTQAMRGLDALSRKQPLTSLDAPATAPSPGR